MIIRAVEGDILQASEQHLAFGVNAEGDNAGGFAGIVARHMWPELSQKVARSLGDVITHTQGDKNLYGLVCLFLKSGGWNRTPHFVYECLEKMPVPDTEEIAILPIGSGPIGVMHGVDLVSILDCMQASSKRLVIYTRQSATRGSFL